MKLWNDTVSKSSLCGAHLNSHEKFSRKNFGKFCWTLPSNSVPDTWHHWEPLRMLRCHCYWWRSHWPVQWWPDPGPRHDIGMDQFGAKGTNQFCWSNWNGNSAVEVRSCSLIFQKVSKNKQPTPQSNVSAIGVEFTVFFNGGLLNNPLALMFLHQRVHVEASISFSWHHKATESTQPWIWGLSQLKSLSQMVNLFYSH